jgi:hypothetical protein
LGNFFQRGTQPGTYVGEELTPFLSVDNCDQCHIQEEPPGFVSPILTRWNGSMMANAALDPVFQAAMVIANQDAQFSGDLCLRCHTPVGWIEGRSVPTDGSSLIGIDYEGVNCNFCHRMVDPVLDPGHPMPPTGDDIIRVTLENADLLPIRPGGATYVIDPDDSRRGPFPFDGVTMDPPYVRANYHYYPGTGEQTPIIESPYHTTSQFCGTCHDVSNPAFTRQSNGSYTLNPIGEAHPTGDPYDMFPIERTFSEWLNSTYATVGVDAMGVFGGNHATGVMRTCQDCHMPNTQGYGCGLGDVYERPDVPAHDFNGGNAWVQEILKNLYGDVIAEQDLTASQDRAIYMLQNAATLEVAPFGCDIQVRVVNETGHKLPTGYPEGRRMWIEVEFLDAALQPVAVRGAYDGITADLTTADTKVYEAVLGMDATVAAAAGLPEGPSFHFALNNKYYKDNRIPPRGFTNAAFEAAGAAPVAALYEDGQHWDDAAFRVPPGATSAVVSLYYQTAAREYIEFLRDENHTNDVGDMLHLQWELTGKSPPVLMRQATILDLTAGVFADADCNGTVDLNDHAALYDCLSGPGQRVTLGCEALDADLDGETDLRDVAALQQDFGEP